jgi:hypothetical protein
MKASAQASRDSVAKNLRKNKLNAEEMRYR